MPRKPLMIGEWCVPSPGAKGNGVAVPAQPAKNIAELRSGSLFSFDPRTLLRTVWMAFGTEERSKL